jgi:hypothetical protein
MEASGRLGSRRPAGSSSQSTERALTLNSTRVPHQARSGARSVSGRQTRGPTGDPVGCNPLRYLDVSTLGLRAPAPALRFPTPPSGRGAGALSPLHDGEGTRMPTYSDDHGSSPPARWEANAGDRFTPDSVLLRVLSPPTAPCRATRQAALSPPSYLASAPTALSNPVIRARAL